MSEIDRTSLENRRIPNFMLRGFWDELSRRGVSLSALESASGVSRPSRDDFLTAISGRDMHRLFVAAQELTNDERIGLSVGRAMGATSLHLVGHLVLASPSLTKAIALVGRAEPHFGQRLPTLEPIGEGRMRFGVASAERELTRGARVEAELTAVLLYDVARLFLDESFGSPTIHFSFAAPEDRLPYQRVFSGQVEFVSEGTYCVFPRAALRRRSGSDAGLLEHLFKLARDHYGPASDEENWTSRVRAALRSQSEPRLLERDTLASRLGLSSRGLSRRLSREGSSLSQLIGEVMFERARASLRRPGATAAQVAEELGYEELSSFFRAFRRWSGGVTPKEYRERGDD